MSGTSLDGVDVAVIDIRGRSFRTIAHSTSRYPRTIRERLLNVSDAATHTREIARLNFELPEIYARSVLECGVAVDTIQLVGCHGQTIYHERQCTLQIGNGCILAERLGVPVVSDFRPRDMAAGGRGAPLVPFLDYWLFRHAKLCRVALNIGGIANVTGIPPGARPEEVIAFDTGPGNMIIDALVNLHTKGRQSFDRGGRIAASGHVNRDLLNKLLRDPYYRQKPPKTAGREQYGREFVRELLATRLPLPDLIATATAFTAATVALGVQRFVSPAAGEILVSGGGAHNRQILGQLAALLPQTKVRTTAEFGLDVDAKEAIAFAVLAYETWNRRPSNLPSATGARRPVILGKVSYGLR